MSPQQVMTYEFPTELQLATSLQFEFHKKNKKRPPLTLEQLEARMLMAIDVLEQQIDEVSSSGLFASSSSTPTVSSPTVQTGNRIQLLNSGNVVTSGQRIVSSASQFQLQLLRDANGTLPNLNWTITSTDRLLAVTPNSLAQSSR